MHACAHQVSMSEFVHACDHPVSACEFMHACGHQVSACEFVHACEINTFDRLLANFKPPHRMYRLCCNSVKDVAP